MADTRLYGALPGRNPPRWADYDALEIAGCTAGRVPCGDVVFSRATSFVVFGHRRSGEITAITDATSMAVARTVATELAVIGSVRGV